MLDDLVHWPLAFWFIALAIALADSTVLLRADQFTFHFGGALRVKVRAVRCPFLLLNKEPLVTLANYPAGLFFFCSVSRPPAPRPALKAGLIARKRLCRDCRPFSWLALAGMLAVFLIGPVLSVLGSLEAAILTVWSTVYALATVAIVRLYRRRDDLHLRQTDIAAIGAELLFCPFLIVNILKKIAVRQTGELSLHALADDFVDQRQIILEAVAENQEQRQPAVERLDQASNTIRRSGNGFGTETVSEVADRRRR
jgi:hypothetical protein